MLEGRERGGVLVGGEGRCVECAGGEERGGVLVVRRGEMCWWGERGGV